jgi:HEAT repeat protein
MELKDFEEIVENMILQLSYPGFDSRSLNLALPTAANEAPVKLYLQALNSKSTNVRLSALRWFQNRAGAAKHHIKIIATLLVNSDPWVRKEAIKTIEITKLFEPSIISEICALLKDEDQIVRIEAAKALGNLTKEIPKTIQLDSTKTLSSTESLQKIIINSLQEATDDPVLEVRRKAIKALRKLGAFSAS